MYPPQGVNLLNPKIVGYPPQGQRRVVVPEGSIALWSGTLATIPANWVLCDGGGGTPNLIARFLRGAPAATEPGTTGGSDSHTHPSMTSAGGHTHTANTGDNHSHKVGDAGNHDHGYGSPDYTKSGTARYSHYGSAGGHNHTTNLDGGHTHTMDTQGAHTHPISTDDGRPPYYEVAFIQAGAGAAVDIGLIIIWTGLLANIPAGWALCDGGDSRPDLRASFIRGVNTNLTDPGGVGGNATHGHTETNAAAHKHTENLGSHYHTFNAFTWTHIHSHGESSSAVQQYERKEYSGAHTHGNSNAPSHAHTLGNSATHHLAHTVNAAASLPAYYDVAYIINTAAAIIPPNGVLVWTGLLANIPAGYNLCDGGGGRPELRAKFSRGSAAGIDPGGGGGSDTHIHTDQDKASHSDHSQTSTGGHTHAATNSIGGHKHNPPTVGVLGKDRAEPKDSTGGAHSHTYSAYGNHTHPSLTSAGGHNHNPWSTDDGRPAYYEVAFIMKA